jgi:hypothetical protein
VCCPVHVHVRVPVIADEKKACQVPGSVIRVLGVLGAVQFPASFMSMVMFRMTVK